MPAPKRVNTEYLRLFKEGFLLWCLALAPRASEAKDPKSILLVVPCLIGEFAAAIPAIADFIRRHGGAKVDLMVTPSLVPLARAIRGVGNVYAVHSVYGREEGEPAADALPERYDLLVAMRMSSDAFRVVRATKGALRTSALAITKYGIHLLVSVFLRETPRQWIPFNFEILGGTPHLGTFDTTLSIEPVVYAKVAAHVAATGKTVLVHTGSNWPMKHWPVERWVELLKKLRAEGNYHFVFIGGGAVDEADYAAIAPRLDSPTGSLIGTLSVLETLALMRNAHGFLGIDSGPANLARLAELPSLTLYGAGPHMYLPYRPSDIGIDKTKGGGLWQMYVAREQGFIHQITPLEAAAAFKRLTLR